MSVISQNSLYNLHHAFLRLIFGTVNLVFEDYVRLNTLVLYVIVCKSHKKKGWT